MRFRVLFAVLSAAVCMHCGESAQPVAFKLGPFSTPPMNVDTAIAAAFTAFADIQPVPTTVVDPVLTAPPTDDKPALAPNTNPERVKGYAASWAKEDQAQTGVHRDVTAPYYTDLLLFIDAYVGSNRTGNSCEWTSAVSAIYDLRDLWPNITYGYCLEKLVMEIPREFEQQPEYRDFRIAHPSADTTVHRWIWARSQPSGYASPFGPVTLCSIAQQIATHLKQEHARFTGQQARWEDIQKNITNLQLKGEQANELKREQFRAQQEYAEQQVGAMLNDFNKQQQDAQFDRERFQQNLP